MTVVESILQGVRIGRPPCRSQMIRRVLQGINLFGGTRIAPVNLL